jgi:hypothetical protein
MPVDTEGGTATIGQQCEPQFVSVYLPVEAGAIDSFVNHVRSIQETTGAKAHLHMADHTIGWVRKSIGMNLRI